MAKPTYWELLRHPKWQRKRLAIMERADFKCENCDNDDETLNVHHSYYEKGLMPWDYPDESLHCLCETCHKAAQDLMTALHRQIGQVSDSLEELYGFSLALQMASDPEVVVEVRSYGVAKGLGAYWGISAEEVINLLRDTAIDGYALENCRRSKNGRPPLETN